MKLARPLGAQAALVKYIPDRTPYITGNLKVLAKHRFSKIVIYIGAKDVRLHQSKVTKGNFVQVLKIAKAMSVVCYGEALRARLAC